MKRSLLYVALTVLVGLFLGPFGWLLVIALKDPSELASGSLLPSTLQWGNFGKAFTFIDFLGYTRNSLIVSGIYSVLATLASAWAGFGFARLSAPGKKVLFGVLVATMMLPQIITLIPTYLLFAKLEMVGTYWPWVLWGLSGAAYLIFLFRQFFAGLPKELEEAAILDGCGYPRVFWRIFLPQSWPVLTASLVMSFTWSWGDYVAPTLLLNSENTTLAVALTSGYVNEQGLPLHHLVAAGAVMYVLPVLALFLAAQRGFVGGFANSGLK